MKKNPRVFVSRKIYQEALDVLKRNDIEFSMNNLDRPLTKSELIGKIGAVDGLICMLTDAVDNEIMGSGPSLKVISNVAVGFNNIDVAAATARGIMVTNTPDVLTETTADLAFALMIGAARRIPEGDRAVRKGRLEEWQLMQKNMGADLYGKTLGIVGMGRIGLALSRRAHKGFNMSVLYYSRTPNRQAEEEVGAHRVGFDDLLAESDFVSIHVPLTESTRRLFGAAEFKKMKKGAFLINTSRGPVVDETALAHALSTGTIRGAGLDVYEDEPVVNPDLLKITDNLALTPHIGSATLATRTKMAIMAAENMAVALSGRLPPNLVNEPNERGN